MRRRASVAVGVMGLGLGLGAAARQLPAERAWNLVAGICLLVALALGVTMLPWWGRWRPSVTPVPYLFKAPRPSERWCSRCGSATPKKGPCRLCGHLVRPTPFSRGN